MTPPPISEEEFDRLWDELNAILNPTHLSDGTPIPASAAECWALYERTVDAFFATQDQKVRDRLERDANILFVETAAREGRLAGAWIGMRGEARRLGVPYLAEGTPEDEDLTEQN